MLAEGGVKALVIGWMEVVVTKGRNDRGRREIGGDQISETRDSQHYI